MDPYKSCNGISKSIDHKMLDLSIRNKSGHDVLFYLVQHNDLTNFRQFLDREELSREIAARPFADGQSPLATCLRLGRIDFVRDVLIHPTAKDKFSFGNNGKQMRH